MQLEQRIGRAPDGARDAERAQEAAREGGLAGAELTGEINDCQCAGIGTDVCDLPPEGLGLFCGSGLKMHVAARD